MIHVLFNFEWLEHLTNPSNTNLNITGVQQKDESFKWHWRFYLAYGNIMMLYSIFHETEY